MTVNERDWLNPEIGKAHVLLEAMHSEGHTESTWISLEISDCTRSITLDFSFNKSKQHEIDAALYKINKLREYLDMTESIIKNRS